MNQRRSINVTGIVQGVGFRPFVHSLASRLQLAGFVRNQAGEVQIEVEGEPTSLDRFLQQLRYDPPPLARIRKVSWQAISPQGSQELLGAHRFSIKDSDADSSSSIFVAPDVATCQDCLRELRDPLDRRYRYAFLNCTNCGPRLTIVQHAPYDRINTTMASFEMCPACDAEYDDPSDRRFHAQPTACPRCGPRLQLLSDRGDPIQRTDPLQDFAAGIKSGKIGAMKGLGGYHLVCLASDETAVRELRRRKHRDEKPMAVMVRSVSHAHNICHVDPLESELLTSARRPIVLLRRRKSGSAGDLDADVVADLTQGNPFLGVMLPYTPLHELLMEAVDCQAIVMTSGNRSDEPIAYQDDDAIARLRGIADIFLVHDRPIHVRCDDSVTRVMIGKESIVRRSRGYSPDPIWLPFECTKPILAVGAQLKGVFALGRDDCAIPSHHMGDLDYLAAFESYRRDIELYEDLFDVQPKCIAHDMHPDYASTGYAIQRAGGDSIPTVAVQHHHAHLASCMTEHRLDGDVIGVILDGSGYGTDHTIWGGEFLVGGYETFIRAGHLRRVRLPGGDRATKQPWRMGLSHLMDANCKPNECFRSVTPEELGVARQMIASGLNSPWTSSMGRLFDAVAAIAGIREQVSFEGQAAIELEAMAHDNHCTETYPATLVVVDEGNFEIDTRPLIREVARDLQNGIAVETVCRRFQNTIAEIILKGCLQLRRSGGLNRVVLSGGVFMNEVLTVDASSLLENSGFTVYRQQLVPPNDGGISLGQLAVAAAWLNRHQRNRACV